MRSITNNRFRIVSTALALALAAPAIASAQQAPLPGAPAYPGPAVPTGDFPTTIPSDAPPPAPPLTPAPAPDVDTAPPEDVAPPATPITIEEIHTAVDPYGAWVQVDGIGPCWQPYETVVGADFSPYCDGRWIYTDYGWSWCSSYAWGGIPFHYGRWYRPLGRGWCWAPDTCWGPAWVSWRGCDGYVGWAPLGPCIGGFQSFARAGDFCFVSHAGFRSSFSARGFASSRGSFGGLYARSSVIEGGRSRSGGRAFGPAADVIARASGTRIRTTVADRSGARSFSGGASIASGGGRTGFSSSQPRQQFAEQIAPAAYSRAAATRQSAVAPQTRAFASVAPRADRVAPQTYARSFSQTPARVSAQAPRAITSRPFAAAQRAYSTSRARVSSAPQRTYSAPQRSFSAPQRSFSTAHASAGTRGGSFSGSASGGRRR